MISQKYLKERLFYDEVTGVFKWRKRKPVNDTIGQWNKRYAGTVAGTPGSDGAIIISLDRKRYGAHVLAWFYVTGKFPQEQIDHKNLDRSDNSYYNLREATNQQNNCNKGLQSNNKSGYKGVVKRSTSRWEAYITVNKKQIYLGSATSPQGAYIIYCRAAKEYFGDFARF